ncbi:hypothetical protein [Lachnospira multipara]|uniref:hypothetical protein n=1 Tax=Lachnospira multipara TaxID=28051 RepID=UPI0004864D40|nr:hypothetical protein [Lachnospira multipara]
MKKNDDESNMRANSIAFTALMGLAAIGCVVMYVYNFITNTVWVRPHVLSAVIFCGYAIRFITKGIFDKDKISILVGIACILLLGNSVFLVIALR